MTKDKEAGRKARANKPVEDADFGRPSLDPCQRNEWYSIRKKAQTFALLCLAGLLSWFATPVYVNASEVPQLINYSGKLSGAEGKPFPTGDYTLSFSIYDHATAVPCEVADTWDKVCARRVWGPQIFDGNNGRGHGNQVPVVKGFFSAILGPYDTHGDPIAQAFTSSDRFIEVTFEDAPNLPRQQVFSTPFALRSSGETPVGGIIMFSGRASELPENWRVCRGQVVTDQSSPLYRERLPDLRDLFVRGASNWDEVGNIGGRDLRDTHKHSVSVSAHTRRDGLDGYITRSLLCVDDNDYDNNGRYNCDHTDLDFSPASNNAILDDPNYVALVKRRGNEDSHGHHITTDSDIGWDIQTSLDNRPKHMNLLYIIRIK